MSSKINRGVNLPIFTNSKTICHSNDNDNNTPLSLNEQAIELYNCGKTKQAIDTLRKALTFNPNFIDGYFNLGLFLFEQSNTDEAILTYKKLLSISANDIGAHKNIAYIYYYCGDIDLAISHWKKITEIDSFDYETHYNLGVAYTTLANISQAIEEYLLVIKISPQYFSAHYNIGNLFKQTKNYQLAIKHYQLAINFKNDFTEVHYNLGNTYSLLKQNQLAINSYKDAIASNPDYLEAYYNLVPLLIEEKDFDLAIHFCKAILTKTPKDATILHLLSSISGKTTPAPPQEYIKTLFDDYAQSFDKHLVEVLNYQSPSELRTMFDNIINTLRNSYHLNKFDSVLDLGCGTGLSGKEFRPLSKKLIGVDISTNMLLEAKKKNIYDYLEENNILTFLQNQQSLYDLILAIDTLPYIGDLFPLFNLVHLHSKKDGFFIFSVEKNTSNNYSLNQTGRYSHSHHYIESLANQNLLSIESYKDTKIRKENKGLISGINYILKNH